ncbi:hypothetical protein XHC_0912 [Xanthomonas hortorum pv. carotae str. M081]|nr:hypothetical protein XHC_0912 [Xanthomonas hortorum pv. carotae str. M081]
MIQLGQVVSSWNVRRQAFHDGRWSCATTAAHID